MPAEIAEILHDAEAAGDRELARLCRESAGLVTLAAYAKRLALNDLARAVRLTERLSLARTASDPITSSHVAAARAYALALSNDFDGALAVLHDARAEAAVATNPLAGATLDLASVQPLARAGRLAEAEHAALAARDGFERTGHALEAAMADINLGVVLRMRDEPARALAHFDRARPVLAGDPVRRGMIDSNRAEAYMDLDDFARASHAFEQARRAMQESNDHHAAAVVEGNLGNLLSRQGLIDRAVECFERARRAFAGSGARGDLARLRAEEAEALAQAGDYRESRRAFAEAVTILDEVGMRREAARARLWEAIVAGRAGELEAAGALQRDAAARFEPLDMPIGMAEVTLLQAELAHLSANDNAAIALQRSALDSLRNRPLRALQARLMLARTLVRLGRLPEARRAVEEIEGDPLLAEVPPLRPAVAHVRGLLELAVGRRGDAARAFAAALTALEQTRGTLRIEQLRSALVSANFDIYHDAWTSALDDDSPRGRATAFDALERLRSRSLLDVLQSAGASSAATASAVEDAELEAEYRAAMASLRAAYEQAGASPERAVERTRRSRTTQLPLLEARVEELERRLLATRRLKPVLGRPMALDEVADRLRPDQAIVKYFLDRERISAMVVRKDRTEVFRALAPRTDIRQLAQQLRFAVECVLSRGDAATVSPRLIARTAELRSALQKRLLSPLAAVLSGTRCLGIVPVAELHGVPLHALGEGDDFPAISSYLPSATIGLRLAEAPESIGSARGAGLAVGVSDAAAPHMDQEAIEVAARWPAAALLTGGAATRAAFIEQAQRAARIHLAVHGAFAEQQPMSARLQFADGWLSARELAGLRLPGSSVVLASCDVGQTAGDAGEERYGLIRALLVAGARRVVASLWPLHDGIARQLFRDYYELESAADSSADGAGSPLAGAAQRRRNEGVPWAFWAGVISVGAMP
ncbi:MAG: CHAT domain-containing tetratricopeptide repeat protein [Phycisphaerae bacterium]|nr:CHAT domain-containing tetratricopeptide repeat protein [Phycisphaerae bacterium]